MFRSRIFLLALLTLSFIACHSQDGKKYLEPADNNEARLNRAQPPGQVMDIFGIKEGMIIAEIGAGRGRYLVHLADRVGEKGKVYAEDISKKSLDFLKTRCKDGGLKNVEIILGDVTDPKLPRGKLDFIFIISSYHHFDDPVALMKKARESLKPDGKVGIGEWVKKDYDETREGRSPKRLEDEMRKAGFSLVSIDKSLKGNDMYLYLFEIQDKRQKR